MSFHLHTFRVYLCYRFVIVWASFCQKQEWQEIGMAPGATPMWARKSVSETLAKVRKGIQAWMKHLCSASWLIHCSSLNNTLSFLDGTGTPWVLVLPNLEEVKTKGSFFLSPSPWLLEDFPPLSVDPTELHLSTLKSDLVGKSDSRGYYTFCMLVFFCTPKSRSVSKKLAGFCDAVGC
jgi:hypothetical protein